jgi:hypothetical protein
MVTLRLGKTGRSQPGPDMAPARPGASIFQSPPATLVLGFGNVLLSDDGAGVKPGRTTCATRLELGPERRSSSSTAAP